MLLYVKLSSKKIFKKGLKNLAYGNSNIISEEDFLCSSVTDRHLLDTDGAVSSENNPTNEPTSSQVLAKHAERDEQSEDIFA